MQFLTFFHQHITSSTHSESLILASFISLTIALQELHLILEQRTEPIQSPQSIELLTSTSSPFYTETIEEKIERYADIYGADADLAKRIIKAESNFIPTAQNPHSSAGGLWQIIDGTWAAFGCTGERYDADDNLRCGFEILTKGGVQHWDASRAAWH